MSRHSFDEIDLIMSSSNGLNVAYVSAEQEQKLIETEVRVRLEDAEGSKPYVFGESNDSRSQNDSSRAKLSPVALARLITYAIELKGPLRVGEVGHFLQVATGDNSILLYVKMQYKGLKNLISGFSFLFHLDNDHPYNPTVSLSESYIEKMLTLRTLAETELSQYYYFESPISSYSTLNDDSGHTDQSETSALHHQVKSRTDSTESVSDDIAPPDPHIQEEAIEWAHGIVAILEDRGSMPVGEIGKCLQQYSGAGNELPQQIKAKFKGLKKLIEGFKLLFCIDQSHSLNPCVSLSPDFVSAKRKDNNPEAVSSYFVFEPVKGYVPSVNGSMEALNTITSPSPPPLNPTVRTTLVKTPTSNKASKKNTKKTPPSQKGSGQKYQQGRNSQWPGHTMYSPNGYPIDPDMGYTYQPTVPPQRVSSPQYGQYYSPQDTTDETSFTSSWVVGGNGAGAIASVGGVAGGVTDGSHIPSSWSEYKKTVVPQSSKAGTGNIVSAMRGYASTGNLRIPRTPPRDPNAIPSMRLDSESAVFGGGFGMEVSRPVGSPEDTMQLLSMSPNYAKYSHILNMLDIE